MVPVAVPAVGLMVMGPEGVDNVRVKLTEVPDAAAPFTLIQICLVVAPGGTSSVPDEAL